MPIISTNTVWHSGEVHNLAGATFQIASDVTLTIEPGVEVSNGAIQSFGTLNVQGTSNSQVKFVNTMFLSGSTDATHVGKINIAHANISGGGILPAGASSGDYGAALTLTDSIITGASYIYLWYPSADSHIERNVFKSTGGISVGHSDNHSVYILNNLFLNQTTYYAIENWASYSGKTIVENNSFLSTDKIAMSVPRGYTSAAISAANNYFGTTDTSIIDKMILDKQDDLSSASIISTSHTTLPSATTPKNVNSPPTGSIFTNSDGLLTPTHVLTIANYLVDADGIGKMSYQWQANGVNLSGETAEHLILTQALVGQYVSVVATYTDGGGTTEHVSSNPIQIAGNANHLPTGNVSITGTMIEGQVLSAVNSIVDIDGINNQTKFVYQWNANGKSIVGANSNTLVLTHDLVGKSASLTISYVDMLGAAETVSSGFTATIGGNFYGTTGNDTLTGSAGNDTFDGAAGNDTVKYSGSIHKYKISHIGKVYTVADQFGGDGVDTLLNVESVQFSDFSVNLMVQDIVASIPKASAQRLMELYVAFFNRVPDADGLAYWVGQMKAGQTTEQIASAFYSAGVQFSDLTHYTANMSNADFINVVYKNVLGRTDGADQSGLDYWSSKLVAGTATRGSLVSFILDAAHGFKGDATWGWVADLLDNKIAVAHTFAIDLGLNYLSQSDSILHGMEIAAAVTSIDTNAALRLIGIPPQDIVLI